MARPPRKITAIHPGEILLEEFLKPLGISQYRLAKDTSVPPRRINEIVRGTRTITADTALRLARHFGTSERFWMNLQTHHDLEVQKERLAGRLEREVTVRENREERVTKTETRISTHDRRGNQLERSLRGLSPRPRYWGCSRWQIRGPEAEAIRARFSTTEQLIAYPREEIWYTDDTQMAIGVAETLAAHGQIIQEYLCQAFVANYVPSRGYGRGARAILEAMEDGRDYRQVAEHYFPGGSFGNGAAMRVAPVGLMFRDDRRRCGNRLVLLPSRPTCTRWGSRGRSCWRWRSLSPHEWRLLRPGRVFQRTTLGL